jgi:hypothetical protein
MSDLKFWSPVQATIDTDIKGLMGMKLIINAADGNEWVGIVAGVDPYIGCSIVAEDDPTLLLHCLGGPYDPELREEYLENDQFKSEYYHDFKAFVDLLHKAKKTGRFEYSEYMALITEAYGGDVSGSGACPFGV